MKASLFIRVLAVTAILASQLLAFVSSPVVCADSETSDSIDITVTATPNLYGISAPTGLTLTDLGFVHVEASWTPGGNYTMLRGLRDGIPSAITDGELIYYGPLSSVNITGMQLDLYDYGVAAWTFGADNVTYLEDHATATIGGEGMEEIADNVAIAGSALGTLGQAALAFSIFAILAFFVWLTVRVDSDWGSPILAIITGGMSLMIGFNAADLIDGQYVTTGYGLAISAALITFSLICLGWAWSMMFTRIKE